jgi:hypothetical protein
MKIIVIDFETYFDEEYSLKKMTTEEYIRDPQFEAHGAAVYIPGSESDFDSAWLNPRQLKETCELWERWRAASKGKITMVAHHAHFDGLILNEHFDFRPDIWVDTLSMARVCFDAGVKNGLEDLASRLGLQPKSVPYDLFKGKHWHELEPAVQNQVAQGAMHDCELTWQACEIMLRGSHPAVPYAFPLSELPVVSATVKMFTEPVLMGDLDLLGQAWYAERDARDDLFARLSEILSYQVTGELLRKDDQFAVMLDALGVEPEVKVTARGNSKYAFAKSDSFMQDLLYGGDEDVALLVEARLKAKSSIYMTRVERFGSIATRGAIPIYLAYAAAHTRRWGGGDKQNAQNLPRPDSYQPRKGALRRAIKAP